MKTTKNLGQQIRIWHQELTDKYICELRHCKHLPQIWINPAFVDLCSRLQDIDIKNEWAIHYPDYIDELKENQNVDLITGLFVHLTQNQHKDGIEITTEMKNKKNGRYPIVNGTRFRQLLSFHDKDRLFDLLISILRYHRNFTFDLEIFARDLFFWNDAVKRKWALNYYSDT